MDRNQFIRQLGYEQESLRRFLCVLCGGDSFRADDLAQEAMLKAYMSFEKFEGRARFSTWLFRIAYNCFYDYKARVSRTEGDELSPVHERKPEKGLIQTPDTSIRTCIWPSGIFLKRKGR